MMKLKNITLTLLCSAFLNADAAINENSFVGMVLHVQTSNGADNKSISNFVLRKTNYPYENSKSIVFPDADKEVLFNLITDAAIFRHTVEIRKYELSNQPSLSNSELYLERTSAQ